MSADVEKTRQQLALREKEANEKLGHWRQLEHQLNRLESQLKEAELNPQRGEGGDGGTTGRQKLRELTKQRIGLQLQVSNARFDHEDAAERVKAAQRDLEKAEFAAAQARLPDPLPPLRKAQAFCIKFVPSCLSCPVTGRIFSRAA